MVKHFRAIHKETKEFQVVFSIIYQPSNSNLFLDHLRVEWFNG